MRPNRNYPIWLSGCMFFGPFFMIGGIVFRSRNLIWACEIIGATMVMIALLYLAKKLHEQSEEVMFLRELVSERNNSDRTHPSNE